MKILQNRRSIALLCLLALLVAALTACSSKAPSADSMGGYKNEASAGGMDMSPDLEAGKPGATGEYERKIIRTVSMTAETLAYDEALATLMSALSAHGGYVENSSATGTGYNEEGKGSARRASYTLRIPAENLDAFLEALRNHEGIRILSQEARSSEITAAYYDAKTRLETLTSEKDSLTAMLESFTDHSDISAMLQVRERLYDVIEEMEALQTKINLYDSQVDMSTVHISIAEVRVLTVAAEPTFGERISESFRESWADFAEGCQGFAVFLVGALPTLLVMLVIGGSIALIIILATRSGRKKKK